MTGKLTNGHMTADVVYQTKWRPVICKVYVVTYYGPYATSSRKHKWCKDSMFNNLNSFLKLILLFSDRKVADLCDS